MAKTLCKRKKAAGQVIGGFGSPVDPPRFLCMKCGLVALRKKSVCRPQKLGRKAAEKRARRVA